MDNPSIQPQFEPGQLGRLKGFVRVFAVPADQDLLTAPGVLVHADSNIVVSSSKYVQLASLIPKSPLEPIKIAKIGTGVVFSGSSVLNPHTKDMTDLYTPAFNAPIYRLGITDVADPVLTIAVAIDSSMGNGLTLTEVGLFSGEGRMVSAKSIGPMVKDPSYGVRIEWSFSIP